MAQLLYTLRGSSLLYLEIKVIFNKIRIIFINQLGNESCVDVMVSNTCFFFDLLLSLPYRTSLQLS